MRPAATFAAAGPVLRVLPGQPEPPAGQGRPVAQELPERLAARALEPLPCLDLPKSLPNQAASAPRRVLVVRQAGPGPVALPERRALDEHPSAGASSQAAYRGAEAAEEVPSHRPVRHRE
jgi:hypothetical protein